MKWKANKWIIVINCDRKKEHTMTWKKLLDRWSSEMKSRTEKTSLRTRHHICICFLGLLSHVLTNWWYEIAEIYCLCSVSKRSKIKVLAGPRPSKGSRRESFLAFSFLWWSPINPWHFLSCSWVTLVCVCIFTWPAFICVALYVVFLSLHLLSELAPPNTANLFWLITS